MEQDIKTYNAYAKINLFLEVCNKRPDGYHNIDSVMQTVSLHDVISVKMSDRIEVSNDAGLPNDESNLAYKGAKLFFDYSKIAGGCEISIQKHIPVSAGLAGGSSDCAQTIIALNDIYNTGYSTEQLCEIGKSAGADVPFCIAGGCKVTKGMGDLFGNCSPLPDCFIVISKLGEGVSTPWAYSKIDDMRNDIFCEYKKSDDLVSSLNQQNIYEICKRMFNRFEEVVMPERENVWIIKNLLKDNGALASLMSGSGTSVFGIFDNKEKAEKTIKKLKTINAQAHLCKPI